MSPNSGRRASPSYPGGLARYPRYLEGSGSTSTPARASRYEALAIVINRGEGRYLLFEGF